MFIDVHTHKQHNWKTIRSYHFSDINQYNLLDTFSSVGIHPWHTNNENLEDFRNFCINNKKDIIAIGECGIDKIKGPKLSVQKEIFKKQIELATELQLPVIIHMVKSADLVYKMISQISSISFIIHGFHESIEMIRQFKQSNIYFSLGVSIFKPHNKNIRMLKETPLHKIFFETDDNDIHIKKIYQKFCDIRNIQISKLKSQIADNFNKVFKTNGTMD